ncbi:MAG: hypothetical protein ACI9Y1_001367 [Lentisphaeria bacterium]|jgi:hypothetical protein
MPMTYSEKILVASNAKKSPKIFFDLSENLASIGELNYVKIYNGRIMASNVLSENGKKQPVTDIGQENIVGVELLVDVSTKVIQFFSITSSVKGCGKKIVHSVLEATPKDWHVVVVMDWSKGFWQIMSDRYPRLIIS